jgi:DNA-binding NtrC family response regulator
VDFIISVARDLSDVMRLKSKISKLTTDLEYLKNLQYDDSFIGSSPAMARVKYLISQAAASDATILISGETGTGKEVVAREIFTKSTRRDKPISGSTAPRSRSPCLNPSCSDMKRARLPGAQNTGKMGLLEMANGGTILFDEIEELPLAMQAKLLRALQENEIIRVGGNEVVKLDVRVIASTNKNLGEIGGGGNFPPGLLLSAECGSHPAPASAGAKRGHCRPGGYLPGPLQQKVQKEQVLRIRRPPAAGKL